MWGSPRGDLASRSRAESWNSIHEQLPKHFNRGQTKFDLGFLEKCSIVLADQRLRQGQGRRPERNKLRDSREALSASQG